jgi:drug/metabolite transporter (DMT)-like permease
MPRALTFSLTLLAMIAFAGNSLLCRQALSETGIDAASFTAVRLLSGALVLWLFIRMRRTPCRAGSWRSALALFLYAALFSYAYISLPAATGALLLFAAVQVTMIGYGLWTGEHLSLRQSLGLLCAIAGLVGLLLPGISAPPIGGALLMLGAGVAWGVYSLRGKGRGDPTCISAGNFLRTVPMATALGLAALPWLSPDTAGIGYAAASGAVASGAGYAVWYAAMRGLSATSAATVQLSVPVLAAMGAIAFLGESFTPRLFFTSLAILGGILLVILGRQGVAVPASR